MSAPSAGQREREGNSWLLVPRKHQPKVSFLCGVGGCGHSALSVSHEAGGTEEGKRRGREREKKKKK